MGKPVFSFIGQVVPNEIANECFDEIKNVVDFAGNTFYVNLLEGIAENGYYVEAFPSEPLDIINRDIHIEGKVRYKSRLYYKNPGRRWVSLFIRGYKQVRSFQRHCKKKNRDGFLVVNILRISSVFGALLSSKLYGVKSIGVVTDVPGYRIDSSKKSIISVIANKAGKFILNKFDGYVLLSNGMINLIANKPYTIVEGLFGDIDNLKGKNNGSNHDMTSSFAIVYAGSLEYRYGVMNLIEAVRQIYEHGVKCTIYGKGEAEQEIAEISKHDERIVFGGLIARERLLKIEKEASLLVNPRPVEDEYVKYSFPSKNMEYMASGTPTLLTNIPSLPDEYKRYVILAKDNSVEELKNKIRYCYDNREKDEYWEIGRAANKFIINSKNRVVQARKLIELTERI